MADDDNNVNNEQYRQPDNLGAVPRQNHRRLFFNDSDDEDQFQEFDDNRLLAEARQRPRQPDPQDRLHVIPEDEHMDVGPPVHQPRLPALADIIRQINAEMQPEPGLHHIDDPPDLPDPDADRDYIDNLNNAFGQLTMANLVPPPPPVVRQQTYKLPSTGVDTTKHLVKHQIQVSELLAQQQQTINNLLFWVGNPDLQNANLAAMRTSAAQAAQVALDLKAQAVHYQANLQRAEHVTDRYSSTPTIPNWDDIPRDAPMGRPCDIIAACGKFDPKDSDADFGIVWDNLRFYGSNQRYRENNYRMALSFLLDGEAKRVFHDHMDLNPIPPLSQIVDTLYRAYAKPRSTIDDKQALKDVVRNANEPLPKCIARGTIAIDRQRYMHDQREWPVLRKNLIRELVYQVVEHPTQKFINWLENDSIATTGIVCDVDRLIEMVDQEEKRHGWIPKVQKEVVFQAASTGIFKVPDKSRSRRGHHQQGPTTSQHQPRAQHPQAQLQQPRQQLSRQQQPRQPRFSQPQQQFRPPQPQGQLYQQPQVRHPGHPRSRHPAGRGFSKNVPTYSVNATDFDGDDTMTGRDPQRSRSNKRDFQGQYRTQSAGSDRKRSRTQNRDYEKKPSRTFSHSPGPNRQRSKSKKPKTAWFENYDKKYDENYDKNKKKPKRSSSQNQSGSKNVIVRVDNVNSSKTFALDPRNMISDPNVQPDYVIKMPGSEN
jgi:hypothetical protein